MENKIIYAALLTTGFLAFFYMAYMLHRMKKLFKADGSSEKEYILGPEAKRLRVHAIVGFIVFVLCAGALSYI
jgi:hypothetical protein